MGISKMLLLFFTVFLLTASVIHCESEDTEANTTPGDEKQDEEKDDAVTEGGFDHDNGVLILTNDNFDEIVESTDSILVEFYAPWCGHCKTLAPEYEKAAKLLKESERPVPLAKVDATEQSKLASRFGVSGYPTLKFFKFGQPYDYDGPRNAEGIVEYVTEHSDPSWVPPASSVLTLTESNFTETVEANDLMLVEFYAPWCGHCKKLAPELERAAKVLKNSDISIAKVDATEEAALGKKYEVSGYPTMKLFRRGKAFEYKGAREANGIIEYMMGQAGEASKELITVRKTTAFMSTEDVTVIGFFDSAEDKAYSLYQDIANELRENYKCGHTFDKDVANHYKVNAGSVVVLNAERFYTKHESKWHILELKDATKTADVVSFIKSHDVPLVGHMTKDLEEKRYDSARRPLILFFFTVDWTHEHRKATQFWRGKIADIAKDHHSMTFAIVDEDDFPVKMKSFGFEDSGEEMNIGITDDKGRTYSMGEMEEFDSDDIREFIGKFEKGKLKPRIQSQPVPSKQTGPVTVVVGKTFEKVILDSKKDALVELYAPWCGVSKKFAPVYTKLAKNYKGNAKFVIAKMDATLNDSPTGYEAPKEQGYPVIYFAPTDKKTAPVKYEGDRSYDDLVKFVEKHATVSLKAAKEEL